MDHINCHIDSVIFSGPETPSRTLLRYTRHCKFSGWPSSARKTCSATWRY